jgi:hypothetical protein
MARYRARNIKETIKILEKLRQKNQDFLRGVRGRLPRVMINAGQLVEARAKEILTENGHVVTGNLRRSINTQIVEASESRVTVEVGTFVEYAPFVENLPDGGFLFPAAEQTFPLVVRLLFENGVRPELVRWERQ